jgi:hypothetical protein
VVWAAIADRWHPDRNREVWADVPAVETLVIPEVDPSTDLEKRVRRWSYPLERSDLADLARFAAALAQTEGESWAGGDRVLATQAFEERRFLAADRILPWAVPWLRAVGRCFPSSRETADAAAQMLLDIGDRHRPAPMLTGSEGLFPPGYDSYGPADQPFDISARMTSLWGGLVVLRRSLESIRDETRDERIVPTEWWEDPSFRDAVTTWYGVTATRWRHLADRHPGTARLWNELASRALRTAEIAK